MPVTACAPEPSPVLDFVTARTGLVFEGGNRESAEIRVVEAMRRAGITDPAAFAEHLRTDGPAADSLVGDLVIGETYFYREPALFEYLHYTFLPRIGREQGSEHVVRTWSAGCGSGEEAYSLAMLLEDAGLGERSTVLGTDLSLASLARARHAEYGSWSFRGTGAAMRERHFSGSGGRWLLSQAMRDRVRFEPHNLAVEPFPIPAGGTGGYDLILCRNVLMYLSPAVIGRVAAGLYGALAGNGLLCTGPADPELGRFASFRRIPSDEVILYERPGTVPGPGPGAAGAGEGARPAVRPPARAPVAPRAAGPPPSRDHAAQLVARLREQADRDGIAAAVEEAARGRIRYPASAELPFLQAVLLAGSGRHAEAVAAARNALYLDRDQPAIHFVLGASLWNLGDLAGARRGFRNAYDLASALPPAAVVPFTEGETADRVAMGAAAQLAMLPAEGDR